MEYVILGAAPGIAICLIIFYRDLYSKEPIVNLVISFILGCAAIYPAALFEEALGSVNNGTVTGLALFCYLIVGFIEEFCKFLGLRFYSYNQREFDEPLDGIVYAVIVSMGFATLENIKYAMNYQDMSVIMLRAVLTVPAHATFGIIMGYYVGKAKFDSKNSFSLMLTGLLGAIIFHGTFDFFLFLSQQQAVNPNEGNAMIASGALVSFIISLILCRRLIIKDQRISKHMYRDHTPPPPNA